MLIRNVQTIFTGMAELPRIECADIRVENGVIAQVGALQAEPEEAIVDATDCIAAPGWVNTHHHFFQSVLKAVPAAMNAPLKRWSPAVALRFRGGFTESIFRTAVRIALAELVLSGCTTTVDHNFLLHAGLPFDSSAIVFDEAERVGVRLVLARGGMTAAPDGVQQLPIWARPESVDDYIDDVERLAREFHDPSPRARRRVAVAPTTLTTRVAREHLPLLADAARRLGLRLHSHLAETGDDEAFCRARYGMGILDLCECTGWTGTDVWFAHMVHLTPDMAARVADWGVAMAHCPASNARLGSGVAPVLELAQRGVRIGIGVDGAGSNESADMLSELHFAWLMHRSRATLTEEGSLRAPHSDDIVRWATAGGADVLGLETGRLAPGWPADLVLYRATGVGHLGLHDPAAALVVSAARPKVEWSFCCGEAIVRDGKPTRLDIDALRSDARPATRELIRNAEALR
jgi:cytosine/adenosine deaminase-related metal-dependent hydrolase